MKGEAEKKCPAAHPAASNEAAKENQMRVESSAAAAATAAAAAAAPPAAAPTAAAAAPVSGGRARLPFTQLSQLESDMAIARALQDQEQAYYLLVRRSEGLHNRDDDDSDEDGAEDGAAMEPQAVIDGSNYDNDEDFARALQEAEYTTARMMAFAGIQDNGEEEDDEEGEEAEEEADEDGEEDADGENDEGGEDVTEDNEDEEEDEEDEGSDDESDMWEDVDPDNMTYEELVALGEAVGTESKGLAVNLIDELPLSSYKRDQSESSSTSSDHEQCVICRLDYEEDETLLTLPCKHKYHSDCIRQWLQINKVCPVCSAGVDGS